VRRGWLWAGVAAPAVKLTGVVVGARGTPGYSHVRQSISELGARGAPRARLARACTAGNGVLQLVFASALWRGGRRLQAAPFAGIGIAALGGARYPMSSESERDERLHNRYGFAGGALLMAVPLSGVVDRDATRGYRAASLVLAGSSLVTGAAAFAGIDGPRKGLWQRAFQGSSHLWQVLTVLLLSGGPPARRG
jgi:hypothetical protein